MAPTSGFVEDIGNDALIIISDRICHCPFTINFYWIRTNQTKRCGGRASVIYEQRVGGQIERIFHIVRFYRGIGTKIL